MTRINTDTLGAIARAIEEAPLSYRQGLASSMPQVRLRAVDALAGWIGAQLAPPPSYNDRQLTLPIDSGLV